MFGSALDAALGALLTLSKENPEDVFEREFTKTKVNDKEIFVPTSPLIVYANADYDADLFTEDDYQMLEANAEAGTVDRHTDYLEVYKELKEKKQKTGIESLATKERVLYNLMNWLSLRRKGLLMIDAYYKKVVPKIEKVHATQEYVSLDNEAGDKVIGYVDLIADIEGYGTVIIDHKTSSMEYDKDAVLTSAQLTLYTHILEEKYNTRRAGYIVMNKSVIKNRKKKCKSCGFDGSGGRHKSCSNEIDGKRCGGEWAETIDPDIYIQIIIADIPPQTEKIVLENVDTINESIKEKKYVRNLNSCHNWYGGKCPHFNLCYKNDMTGLEDLKKDKKEEGDI